MCLEECIKKVSVVVPFVFVVALVCVCVCVYLCMIVVWYLHKIHWNNIIHKHIVACIMWTSNCNMSRIYNLTFCEHTPINCISMSLYWCLWKCNESITSCKHSTNWTTCVCMHNSAHSYSVSSGVNIYWQILRESDTFI